MNNVKAIRASILFILAPLTLFGQAFRVDPTPAYTTSGSVPFGANAPMIAVQGASVSISYVGGGLATTYTDSTGTTPCPLNAQATLPSGGSCFTTTGVSGQFGFWLAAGQYQYTITPSLYNPNQYFGPFYITVSPSCPFGITCDVNFTTFAGAVAAAGTGILLVTKNWMVPALPTLIVSAGLMYGGGSIQPAFGGDVVFAGRIVNWPDGATLCDMSAGGTCSLFGKVNPRIPIGWWGASCSGSQHDDAPGINAVLSAIQGVGYGRPVFPGTVSTQATCWLNSLNFGTNSINLAFMSNLTLDFSGTVFNTTQTGEMVAMGTSTAGSTTPGYMVSYNALFAASHDQWASPSNDLAAGSNHIILSVASRAASYHAGDAIYIQSGRVISGTPFNAEILVAAANGNAATGEVDFRDPTIHAYTNDGTYPYGLVDVEANTIHNLHIINMSSAKGVAMHKWAIVQCVDCTDEGGNWDANQGGFTTGQDLNLTLDNTTVHLNFPVAEGSGFFQLSTGMTRTRFLNPHFTCTTTGQSNPGETLVSFTEGSGATQIIGGEMDGTGCALYGSDYSGIKIQGVKMTLFNGTPADDNGLRAINFAAGDGLGDGLLFQGNDVKVTDTGTNSEILLGGAGAIITGNKLVSTVSGGTAAITWVGDCGGCKFSDNTVSGGGIVLQSNDNHAFSVTGNIFTGSGSGDAIEVIDNGAQTVPLIIVNNYASGFASDLVLANLTHEHFPIIAPNAFNDAVPYTPTESAYTSITALQAVGPGFTTFTLVDQGGSSCAPTTPIGDAYGGSFVFTNGGTCSIDIYPGGHDTYIPAPHGWSNCTIMDETTTSHTTSWIFQSTNTTTVAFTGTATAGDTMVWGCTRPF